MNATGPMMVRPHRWDVPFGADMTDDDVDALMSVPEIARVRADVFPANVPLRGILRNDARIVTLKPGDIVFQEGDYGNSAFLVLSGVARAVLPPGLPRDLLGRQPVHKLGLFRSLAQL